MKKWNVEIAFTIQAKTRGEAWRLSKEVVHKNLRGLANVMGISLEPLPNPNEWIAVNEPIMKRGKPEPLILTPRGQELLK